LQIMANILEFKPPAGGKAERRKPDRPAEIIIFPGVRYERMGGDQPKAKRDVAKPSTTLAPVLLQG
jgi:hypothetical protein